MKMKYYELIAKHAALMEVGKLVLPRKVAVAVARNLSAFEREIKLYNEQVSDITNRYAAKDDKGEYILDGNRYTFCDDNDRTAFLTEQKELNETETDVEIISFDAAELDRCEEVERYQIPTAVQEASIGWMIRYD